MSDKKFTPYLLMWEDPNGIRCWEALAETQVKGFLKKLLLKDHVNPATLILGFNPIVLHWFCPEYHKNLRDVCIGNVNKEIYGSGKTPPKERKQVQVEETPIEPIFKLGWIAPDGRSFSCDYGGHSNVADHIVGEIEKILNPERYLEEHGWLKVMSGSAVNRKASVGMGEGQKMTDAQIRELQRLGLDNAYGISYYL